MAHVAPDEDDAPLWNVTANGVYPADFYGPRGLDYYGTGYPELDVEAYAIIRKAHGRRDQQVRVYRAVPKGVKTINVGDWVTIVRQYAKDHAIDLQGPGKDGTVISKIFNARDLFTDGNSMLEWGYDPQPYTQRSDREEWERWPGKARSNPWGKAGAGILFVCEEDGTMLLMHRSGSVEEPYTWGVPGGAVIGEGYHDWYFDVEPYTDEQLWEGAQRETWEECGSLPPSLNVSMVEDYFDFKKGDFIFRDFVVNLTKAQKDAWRIDIKNAQDAWENVDWGWFSLEDLPSPLHPGVRFIFDNLGI
jgi:8-oxo-dGTP pyrophosphatase MutT (NUDIX family)